MGVETDMGKQVIVLDGGNVAFDCARTARRLGAEEIHLACLEAREKMTADEEEIEQAQEEGIQIHPAHTFEAILGPDRVSGVRFCNVKSFTFDENRRAVIQKEENSEHVIEADTVIFAVGQRTQSWAAAAISPRFSPRWRCRMPSWAAFRQVFCWAMPGACLALWIMDHLPFGADPNLFCTLFVLGGLAVLLSALAPRFIFCPTWLCGWAIGLTILSPVGFSGMGSLPLQIGAAILVGVWYVGVFLNLLQKRLVRLFTKYSDSKR